jgi:hypothetical protein
MRTVVSFPTAERAGGGASRKTRRNGVTELRDITAWRNGVTDLPGA